MKQQRKRKLSIKSIPARIGCVLLSLIVFVSMLPLAVFAQETTGTGAEADFSNINLMNLNNIPPTGFATTSNPYGYDVDVPFLMVEQNEILDYTTVKGDSGTPATRKMYDTDSIGELQNMLKSQKGDVTEFGTIAAYDIIQGVAFDPNGTGRNDHVAFIGVRSAEKKGHLIVLNTITGKVSYRMEIGNFDWLYDGDHAGMSNWQTRCAVDIAAGDFDGDGKETVVVYTPLSMYDSDRKDLSKMGSSQNRGSVIQEWRLDDINHSSKPMSKVGESTALLMDAYRSKYNWDNNGSIAATSSSQYGVDVKNGAFKNYRNKLGVSMTVDDFDGDGADDIAVLSYCYAQRKENQEIAIYTPVVKIRHGSKGMKGSVIAQTANEVITFGIKSKQDKSDYEVPTAAEITSGDFDGDGDIDLFLAGMEGFYKVKSNGWQVSGQFGMDADNFFVGVITNLGVDKKPTDRFKRAYQGIIKANKWTYEGYNNKDFVWQKLAVEAVAINGKGAAEYVFVNGTLYDCSPTFDGEAPAKLAQASYFGSDSPGSNAEFSSVAVGNFDGNDAGREQVIFRLRTEMIGRCILSGYLRASKYNDKTANGKITEYGKATAYDSTVYTGNETHSNIGTPTNSLLIAIDRDHDGVLAKYKGAQYAYTDPEVKAVLQAAPYFSDVSDAGNNETEYVLTESYELTQSTSNNVSFSVGYSGEFGGDVGPKVAIDSGYALDWTESFEKSLQEEWSQSFSAQAYNSVVVCRIPVFIYCFDIQNANGTWNNKTVMQTSIPQGPVYEQLSVDYYNDFVDAYNAYIGTRDTENKYYRLKKIDANENYLANNEGNPYGYLQDGWGVLNGNPISKSPTALGKNGGINKVTWDKTNTDTHSTEMAHGFYFGLSISFGFGVTSQGISTNLEYSHGKGRSTSKGTAIGASCSVTDIDGPGLMAEGVPKVIIDSYNFQWELGQWKRHLSGPESNMTPFIGFKITNISSPAPAVSDLNAAPGAEDDAILSWTTPTAEGGWPDITGYYVYQFNEDIGAFEKISDKLSADATSYTVAGLESNTNYIFVLTTVKTVEGKDYESIWSNQAMVLTAKNYYTVTVENGIEQGADLSVKHLGNVKIENGDEITEEDVIKVTASPKSAAYVLDYLEVVSGDGNPILIKPDSDGRITYSFVLNDHTKIRLVGRKLNVSAHITYTGQYFNDGTESGSVTATENGEQFVSGNTASGDVVFTATPVNGYVLSEWHITAQGQMLRIPANGSNVYTLSPESGTYVVSAEFVKAESKSVTVTILTPDGGSIEVKDDGGATYVADEEGMITVSAGTVLTFRAIADQNCTFAGWVQDAAKETTTAIFSKTVNENMIIGAEFNVPVTVQVSYATDGEEETGMIAEASGMSSEGTVIKDSVLTFTAQAAEGYRIEKWTIIKNSGEQVVSVDEIKNYDSIEVTADEGLSVIVSFVEIKNYAVTFPNQISGYELNVYAGDRKLVSGDVIAEGTELTAELTLADSCIVKSWTINGEDKGCLGYSSINFIVLGQTELNAVVVDLKGDPGTNGQDGQNGADGKTPYIGANGNWWIGDADTGVKAAGADGQDGQNGTDGVDGVDGLTPYIGENGNWWIGSTDTGVKAAGIDGEDGKDGTDGQDGKDGADGNTPYIGSNGNWWIDNADTGIKAVGTDGKDGQNGNDGQNGKDGTDGQNGVTPHIGSNGNWWIGETDTGIKAEGRDGKDGVNGASGTNGKDGQNGKDGLNGKDGQNGSDGRGIDNAVINDEGYLVLTMSDGTTINAGLVRDNSIPAGANASGVDGTTRTVATVAMVCSGISLLWNIVSLAIVLIQKKKTLIP